MAISLNKNVWIIMVVIFVIITALMFLAFFFQLIFITLMIGAILIVFAEQLFTHYKDRFNEKKVPGWKRKFYITIVFCVWIFIIMFLFWFSMQDLAATIKLISDSKLSLNQAVAQKISPHIPEIIAKDTLIESGVNSIEDYMLNLLSSLVRSFSSFIIAALLIIPLMFFMYFKRGNEIKKSFYDLIPTRFHKITVRALKDISKQMKDFLEGKVIQSIVLAAIYCLGFYAAGVQGWLFFGIFAGFINIIPYIGPVIGAIPPLLVALFLEPPVIILYVFLTIIIGQIIDNFYLTPFMISDKVKVDPLISIIAILVGAQLAGGIGMILAIPIYLIYKIVLKESYQTLVEIHGEK